MRSIKSAKKLLNEADVFFDADEVSDGNLTQVLNMNDVWGWACADGEDVSDKELPRVAELFLDYGWPGILYWVSEKRNGVRSEFLDNNRFIDFVKNEEALKKKIPNSSTRAYKKIKYTLGK